MLFNTLFLVITQPGNVYLASLQFVAGERYRDTVASPWVPRPGAAIRKPGSWSQLTSPRPASISPSASSLLGRGIQLRIPFAAFKTCTYPGARKSSSVHSWEGLQILTCAPAGSPGLWLPRTPLALGLSRTMNTHPLERDRERTDVGGTEERSLPR